MPPDTTWGTLGPPRGVVECDVVSAYPPDLARQTEIEWERNNAR